MRTQLHLTLFRVRLQVSHQDEILSRSSCYSKSWSLMLELMHLANSVSSANKNGSADRIVSGRSLIKIKITVVLAHYPVGCQRALADVRMNSYRYTGVVDAVIQV